jgi:cell division protease FtsH
MEFKKIHLNLGVVVFLLTAAWLIKSTWEQGRQVQTLPYSAFEQQLRDGKIAEVTVGDELVTGKLKAPTPDGKQMVVATKVEPEMAQRLAGFNVPYQRVHEPTWLQNLLSWVVPALVLVAAWSFMARRAAGGLGAGGLLGIGQSKAKLYMEQSTGVRFEDVAGVDEA